MFKNLLLVTALAFPVAASATVSLDTTDAIKNSNWRQAATLITRDLQDTPADAKAWYYKAQIANKLGDNVVAYNAIQTAKTIDPSLSFATDKRMVVALESKTAPRQQQPTYTKQQDTKAANEVVKGLLKFFGIVFGLGVIGGGAWLAVAWYSRRRCQASAYVNRRIETIAEANDYLERATRLHYRVQATGKESMIVESTNMLSRGQTLTTDAIDLDEEFTVENDTKLNGIVRRLNVFKSEHRELAEDVRKKESPTPTRVEVSRETSEKNRREARQEAARQASVTEDYQSRRSELPTRTNRSSSSHHQPTTTTVVNNNNSSSSGTDFVTGMALGSMLSSSSHNSSSTPRREEEPSTSFDWGSSSSSTSSDDSSSSSSFDWGSSSSSDSSSSSFFDSGSGGDSGSFGW